MGGDLVGDFWTGDLLTGLFLGGETLPLLLGLRGMISM